MVGEVNRFSLTRKAYFDEPFQPSDFAMALDGLPVYGMERALLQPGWLFSRLAVNCFSIIHLAMRITQLMGDRCGDSLCTLSLRVTDITDGIYITTSEQNTRKMKVRPGLPPYPTVRSRLYPYRDRSFSWNQALSGLRSRARIPTNKCFRFGPSTSAPRNQRGRSSLISPTPPSF